MSEIAAVDDDARRVAFLEIWRRVFGSAVDSLRWVSAVFPSPQNVKHDQRENDESSYSS